MHSHTFEYKLNTTITLQLNNILQKLYNITTKYSPIKIKILIFKSIVKLIEIIKSKIKNYPILDMYRKKQKNNDFVFKSMNENEVNDSSSPYH